MLDSRVNNQIKIQMSSVTLNCFYLSKYSSIERKKQFRRKCVLIDVLHLCKE